MPKFKAGDKIVFRDDVDNVQYRFDNLETCARIPMIDQIVEVSHYVISPCGLIDIGDEFDRLFDSRFDLLEKEITHKFKVGDKFTIDIEKAEEDGSCTLYYGDNTTVHTVVSATHVAVCFVDSAGEMNSVRIDACTLHTEKPKHPHHDIVIAWLNGETIQYFAFGGWYDWDPEPGYFTAPSFNSTIQYRIKPKEPEYQTSMTGECLRTLYRKHDGSSEDAFIAVANAAIKQHEEDKLTKAVCKAAKDCI